MSSRGKFVKMNDRLLHQLMNALPECTEWGRVYILDFLADNCTQEELSREITVQRVLPNLAHSSPAVVLSAAKIITKYMYEQTSQEKIRSVCRKLAPPLISLMNNGPEIQHIAIRNINLLL